MSEEQRTNFSLLDFPDLFVLSVVLLYCYLGHAFRNRYTDNFYSFIASIWKDLTYYIILALIIGHK